MLLFVGFGAEVVGTVLVGFFCCAFEEEDVHFALEVGEGEIFGEELPE